MKNLLEQVDEEIARLQAKRSELAQANGEIRIVVGQRGWVFIGRYNKDGSNVVLTDAAVIRVWGTTKGLGELRDGPTKSTVIDKCGTVRMHELAVIASIECDSKKWSL